MLAANTCEQRHPTSYLAESETEVSNILNPKLGDLAIVTTAEGTALYRLRDPDEVDGDDYFVASNRCQYVWVLSGPDDSGGGGGGVTSARINALIAANQPVVLPDGEFEMSAAIILDGGDGNVLIEGNGSGRTILDFTGVSGNALSGAGSLSDLPALSGSIVTGQKTITFASNHGLSERDVFIVQNTTAGSFNAMLNHYYDGEYFEVAEVLSATSVLVTQPSYSNYSGVSIVNYKLTPISVRIKGVTMRFREGLGPNNSGVKVSVGRNIQFEDCHLSGSQYTQIFIDRCFDVRVQNCEFFDNQPVDGNNYGLLVANSQHVKVITCLGTVQRHVLTFGGGTADGAVPNQDIQIRGGDYSSLSEWAVDFHGNCRNYIVENVISHTGIALGGDEGEIHGGEFGNNNTSGYAIVFAQMCGMNFLIDGPKVYANRVFQLGLVQAITRDFIDRPSVLDFKNVKLDMGTFLQGSGSISIGINIGTLNVPINGDITVNIDNCSFDTETTAATDLVAIRYNTSVAIGSALRRISITNNQLGKCGVQLIGDIETAVIADNTSDGALRSAIHVVSKATPTYSTDQMWIITGNRISNAMRYGLLFDGDDTYSDAVISGNVILNCSQEGAGFTGLRIDEARNVELASNDLGDTQTVPTQNSIYTTIDVLNLLDTLNRNLGLLINPSLAVTRSGIGTLRDDPPSGSPQWNYTAAGYEWGTGIAATDVIPYNFRRDRNDLVQWLFQNRVAAGNTNAGMAIQVVGGAIGNSASGILAAWAQDHSVAYRAGKTGVQANSDADGLYFAATTAGQVANFFIGSTNLTFQIDDNATAGNTRMLIYDVDSGLVQRVKSGPNGSGPAGVGRQLFINNV